MKRSQRRCRFRDRADIDRDVISVIDRHVIGRHAAERAAESDVAISDILIRGLVNFVVSGCKADG